MDSNPYASPPHHPPTDESRRHSRRLLFLLAPPCIPLAVHSVVQAFIPSEETLYHALFTFGSIIPAWFWSQTMVDRLKLTVGQSFVMTSCTWGTILASATFAPTIVTWFKELFS